jgi:anaerobic magnesium-protoporphyrin IX monomethyl ester cyclase
MMNSQSIKRINFVEFHAKLNTIEPSNLVAKYGTPLLGAIMKENGYKVKILLEGTSDLSIENITDCDLICVPVYSPLMSKIKELTFRIKENYPHIPIILGGPMLGILPLKLLDEEFFKMGDYIVRCEGDEVLPQLVDYLNRGKNLKEVKGISFKEGNSIIHTPDRLPPEIPSTIPDPLLIEGFKEAFKGTRRFKYLNLLQTSRGCAFNCSFCPTSKLFGGRYRNRDIESIIADIKERRKYSPMFLVVDNSFLSNRKRTAKLLERMIEEDLRAGFTIFERHEISKDHRLLSLMKDANVLSIIVGIESLDDENLNLYNKKQKSVNVQQSVKTIMDHGIHVIGTFMIGGDADTKKTARGITEFVKKTGVTLNIFIMHDTEYDETKEHVIPFKRRFLTYYRNQDPENTDFYDYMTGNFVTYFPKKMKPSTLQQLVLDIYSETYSHKNILMKIFSKNIFRSLFGVAQGYRFKKVNNNIRRITDSYYLNYLKEIEEGLYDENEILMEEKLNEIHHIPIPLPVETAPDKSSYDALIFFFTIPGIIRLAIKVLYKRIVKRTKKQNSRDSLKKRVKSSIQNRIKTVFNE